MSGAYVRVEKLIDAEAKNLFNIVADPRQHPAIDGSGSLQDVEITAPERLSLGAKFTVVMKIGARYSMPNTVTEFEEDRLIAWQPKSGHIWRYTFYPVQGGTLVSEEWDARHAKGSFLPVLFGFKRRNRRGMTKTLERLANLAKSEN